VCNEGITQFYLPPTYELYLPLLPIALWLVLISQRANHYHYVRPSFVPRKWSNTVNVNAAFYRSGYLLA